MSKQTQKWWVYINGYRVAETKSIGYKWVYYRTSIYSRYKKIKRSEWDKACLSTLAEEQARLDIKNKARELGISNIKKSRNKRGWVYKTFAEIQTEVQNAV